MQVTTLCEEIELIAEAGDAADALDLARTLVRDGDTARAVEVRRTVTRGSLDRAALRQLGQQIAQEAARASAASATLFSPQAIEGLYALEAQLRESARQNAAMSPTARRAESAARWTASQRRQDQVTVYNEAVDKINRSRGLAANKRQAAAVRAKTCRGCFQAPAANGSCGC
ncbi:hypothetical protein ACFY64_31770 [Streptomyces collinus]|uniref:hypothetical protein n=1 Tax=Streptomyces collinus TaxID=42684 RepID=UPI003688B380